MSPTQLLEETPISLRGVRQAFATLVASGTELDQSQESIVVSATDSPVGPLVTAATDSGVIMLEFGKPSRFPLQVASLRRWFRGPLSIGEHPLLSALHQELQEYFDGARHHFDVPLLIRGTPFQMKVWQALQQIPYGSTTSYLEVARAIGSPGASRAVGNANGMNRIAIVIPCHRVLNNNGELGGYGGGLWRKKKLLQLEAEA